MKRLENHLIGVDQGDTVVFSEFEEGGEMWTGSGPRERRHTVTFSAAFKSAPSVQLSVSLWDADTASALRAEVVAVRVTSDQFDIVFRTWSDSRFARVRVAWTAIGALPHEDDWKLY